MWRGLDPPGTIPKATWRHPHSKGPDWSVWLPAAAPFLHPRISLPIPPLPDSPPRRELGTSVKKKTQNTTTMSGLQIQQAKYTASISGEKEPPSPLTSPREESVIYIFHKPCALHKRENKIPIPGTGMRSTPVSPTQGRGRVKRKSFTRVSLGSWSHEPPQKSISSICQHGEGDEERNPLESETRHLGPESHSAGARPACHSAAERSAAPGCSRASPSWGARTRISLSQLSLFLPEFDSPVRVLV